MPSDTTSVNPCTRLCHQGVFGFSAAWAFSSTEASSALKLSAVMPR